MKCIVGGARSSEYEKQVAVKEKKWSGFTKKKKHEAAKKMKQETKTIKKYIKERRNIT